MNAGEEQGSEEAVTGPPPLATGLGRNLREMFVADLMDLGSACISLSAFLVTGSAQAMAETLAAPPRHRTLEGAVGDRALVGAATLARLLAPKMT